ncbi:MAG: hypothetical protein M3R62_00770 [Acidobacteriota bacterium]|nr:hypothetical protein [Acidobacteriota bacterium]MDQ2977723.1 hypothetical protein [Acidobacteriota bacterium]
MIAVLSALVVATPGQITALLFLFAVAVVILFVIDDDDLPGPRLCRVHTR